MPEVPDKKVGFFVNMKGKVKVKAQTPKGFRDFSPEEARLRESVIATLKEVFSSYGFAPLETPAIEYQETLLGKYGEEADKLIYLFQDRGGRDIGLRYDLTVPLARVVAQYQNELPIPFKRYQIAPVWRADKPQAGRFREFWQADVDTVGSPSLLADAEVIACIADCAKKLGFNRFQIKVNDRNILASLSPAEIRALDKLEKIGKEGVIKELVKLGKKKAEAEKLFAKIKKTKAPESIKKLFGYLESFGVSKDFLKFDPLLARGLDYYTGTIFELLLPDYPSGSVGGGGRYDDLIGQFSGRDLPAVGFSFGIDRVVEALKQTGVLAEETNITAPDILITVMDEKLADYSIKLSKALRDAGFLAEVYPDEQTKLDKQLKYADKRGIPWVAIAGTEEVKGNQVTLKNMQTGKQKRIKLQELTKTLESAE